SPSCARAAGSASVLARLAASSKYAPDTCDFEHARDPRFCLGEIGELMPPPLTAGDSRDVQAEHGQRADHDYTGCRIHPVSDGRRQDDRERPCAEVEGQLDEEARHEDVRCAANGEDHTLQRASSRWTRPPASSDSYSERYSSAA